MAGHGNGQISFSFISLRELLNSFEELEGGSPRSADRETAIYQLVDHLGDLATPVLLRKLFAGPESGRWASLLLLRLGQDTGLRKRIAAELRQQLMTPGLPDLHKLRGLDLLSQLGERCAELPTLSYPEQTAEFSLIELASCIASPAQLARAADILIGDLPPAELVEFVEDMSSHQPAAARRLLGELDLRDDLDGKTRNVFRQIAASLSGYAQEDSEPGPRRPGIRLARHADGRHAIVSYARMPGESPARYRALSMDICAAEGLLACSYLDTVTRGEVDRQILQPLIEEGFELCPLAPGEAIQRATVAMRVRSLRGQTMPRSYYLGRDLLGLKREHLATRAPGENGQAALLARGTELLSRGQAGAARELLARYTAHYPDDSEGLATMGACLMRLGDIEAARNHLARAAWLSPTVGRYHWNRASFAHQEGRLGDCFLALKEYLGCLDAVDSQQRRLARDFIAEYCRQAVLRAPSKSPDEFALHEPAAAPTEGFSARQKN